MHGHRCKNKQRKRRHSYSHEYNSCEESNKCRKSCKSPKYIERLKSCSIKSSSIKSSSIKSSSVYACSLCSDKVTSQNVTTDSLVVGGENIDIMMKKSKFKTGATNVGYDPVTLDPESPLGIFTPIKPEGVNEDVFDTMLAIAKIEMDALSDRMQKGRDRLDYPPVNELILVGSKSIPSKWIVENENGDKMKRVPMNLTWNLEIANALKRLVQDPDGGPRVISIFMQYGYIDSLEDQIVVELFDLGTRMFFPTIDFDPNEDPEDAVSWGEKFNGTRFISSKITNLINENMPDPNNTGCIQLLIIKEEGTFVYFPGNAQTTNVMEINGKKCVRKCHPRTLIPKYR